MFYGYYILVPGINLMFLERVWVPLMITSNRNMKCLTIFITYYLSCKDKIVLKWFIILLGTLFIVLLM